MDWFRRGLCSVLLASSLVPTVVGDALFNQTRGSSSLGFVSTNWFINGTFVQVADDFSVPWGEKWSLSTLVVEGFFTNNSPPPFDVPWSCFLYAVGANASLGDEPGPAALVFSYNGSAVLTSGSVVFSFPEPFFADQGSHYFLSVFPWVNTTSIDYPWNARLRNVSVPEVDCGAGHVCLDDYCVMPTTGSVVTTGFKGTSGAIGSTAAAETTAALSSTTEAVSPTTDSVASSGTVRSTGSSSSGSTGSTSTGSTGSTSTGSTGSTGEPHETTSTGSTSSGTTGSTGEPHTTGRAGTTDRHSPSTGAASTSHDVPATTSHSAADTTTDAPATGATSGLATSHASDAGVSTGVPAPTSGSTEMSPSGTSETRPDATGSTTEHSTTEHSTTEHSTTEHNAGSSTTENATGSSTTEHSAGSSTTERVTGGMSATGTSTTETGSAQATGVISSGAAPPATGTSDTAAPALTGASTAAAPDHSATTDAVQPATGTTGATTTEHATGHAPTGGHDATSSSGADTHSGGSSTEAAATGTTEAAGVTTELAATTLSTDAAPVDTGSTTAPGADVTTTETASTTDTASTTETATTTPTTATAESHQAATGTTDWTMWATADATGGRSGHWGTTQPAERRRRSAASLGGVGAETTLLFGTSGGDGRVRCAGVNGLPAAVRDTSNTLVHIVNAPAGTWVSASSINSLASAGTEEMLFTLSGRRYLYDHTLPTLQSLSFASSTVNVTDGPADLEVQLNLTDTINGVANATLTVASPSGSLRSLTFDQADLVSGTPWNGVFESSAVLSASSEPGVWTVSSVAVADATSPVVGGPNVRLYNATELQQLGLAPTFEIVRATLPTTGAATTGPATSASRTTGTTTSGAQLQENVVIRMSGNVSTFNNVSFLNDVASACNISQSRLAISSVTSGSVVVAFSIMPSSDPSQPSPSSAYANLFEAIQDGLTIGGASVLSINSTAAPYVPPPPATTRAAATTGRAATTAARPATTAAPLVIIETSGSAATGGGATASSIVDPGGDDAALGQTAIIGIAAGVGGGLVLIVVAVIIVVLFRRRRARHDDSDEDERGFEMVVRSGTGGDSRPPPQTHQQQQEAPPPRAATTPARVSIYSAAPMPPPGYKAGLKQPVPDPSGAGSSTAFYDGTKPIGRATSKNALYNDGPGTGTATVNLYKVSPPTLMGPYDKPVRQPSTASVEIAFSELYVDPPPVGRGFFGTVYRGTWRGTNIAVKQLLLEEPFSAQEQGYLRQDAQKLINLKRHANLIVFFGISTAPQDGSPLLISELAEGGSLADLLRAQAQLPPVSKLVQSVAAAVHHLHLNGLLARTLAARNVLLDAAGNIKLSDYGYSMTYGADRKGDFNESVKWWAPEAMNFQFSEKSDAWSFGVVLWEIVTRQTPFAGEDPYSVAYAIANQGMFPPLPDWAPAIIHKLMQHCFQFEPQNRPDFKTISYNVDICSPEEWLLSGPV